MSPVDEKRYPVSRLAFLDCETTGLDPRIHEPWEVAFIVRDAGDIDVERVWQLRPGLTEADPEALQIGRFDERFQVPDGWDAAEVLPDGGMFRMRLHEALHDIQAALSGAHLVGAVPSFDAGMLGALLQRHGRRIVWRHRLICVENLVCGRLGWPTPQGLRQSSEALGISVDDSGRHTALGDARLARDTYDAVMVDAVQSQGRVSMHQHLALAAEVDEVRIAAFTAAGRPCRIRRPVDLE